MPRKQWNKCAFVYKLIWKYQAWIHDWAVHDKICDNQSSIQMTKNPVFHKKTKHIDIQYHFVWDLVQQGVIEIMHCRTKDQVTDIFTKELSKEKFCKFKDDLGIFPNDHYEGEMLE